ncbi:MAG TPA: sulfotransferase [Woeseiaceae bacterium]|nr:sulfotransferase [Woeseiaceae bacterium]
MTAVPDFEQAFQYARELQARGSRFKAERKLRELLARGENRELVLRALVDLAMETRRADDAIAHLVALTEEAPDRLYYFERLAALLDGLGRTEEAIAHYERLLQHEPNLAEAHYNVALLYKKEKRFTESRAAYEEALRLGIERPHEVYSNLGVLWSEMHRPSSAEEMYERALELEPDYVPALFNLGGLREEAGDRERSEELYRRILSLEPGHSGALSRLVHAGRVTRGDEPLLGDLDRALEAGRGDLLEREELLFARGKALDDLERYAEAFEAYRAANELGKQRNLRYDPPVTERAVQRLIEKFDAEWLANASVESPDSPIFICGMFRSGSTLIEQILSGHPAVTAGGELEFLPWLVSRRLGSYPEGALAASREQLSEVGAAYMAHIRESFPEAPNVTDKRPDNFLYLGMIKAIFPGSRIVYTRREPADNCLSIWFQQLGQLAYATDLANIAHYYGQHERLMAHWRGLFGTDILTVEYDQLVNDPEPVVRRLLEHLGLEWDDGCLDFRNSVRPVKTASVWQVREELHSRSSGRWKHYEPFLRNIEGPWNSA